MNNEPLEREPIDRVRARLEALLKANAAPRCGARSKRTGKPCRGAAMPNGRCKLHGGKSTGPRTMEGLERSRRANWKHGHFSREAKAERSRVRAAILAVRTARLDLKAPAVPRSDTDHTGPSISPASMPMARSRGLPRAGGSGRGAELPGCGHAERALQASWWQEHGAAHAGGPRAQQAGKLETRALFAGSQCGTVAPADGNTCAPRSVRLDLRAPRSRRSTPDQSKVAEGSRAQAVQGPELPR